MINSCLEQKCLRIWSEIWTHVMAVIRQPLGLEPVPKWKALATGTGVGKRSLVFDLRREVLTLVCLLFTRPASCCHHDEQQKQFRSGPLLCKSKKPPHNNTCVQNMHTQSACKATLHTLHREGHSPCNNKSAIPSPIIFGRGWCSTANFLCNMEGRCAFYFITWGSRRNEFHMRI